MGRRHRFYRNTEYTILDMQHILEDVGFRQWVLKAYSPLVSEIRRKSLE